MGELSDPLMTLKEARVDMANSKDAKRAEDIRRDEEKNMIGDLFLPPRHLNETPMMTSTKKTRVMRAKSHLISPV